MKGRVLVHNLVAAAAPFYPTYLLGEQAMDLDAPPDGPGHPHGLQRQRRRGQGLVITGGIGSFKPRALPAADGWEGRGLVYFVPQMAEHSGRDVVIVGGGDSAFDWANALHPVASSVALVHRREQFRAHGAMVDRVRDLGVSLFTLLRGQRDPRRAIAVAEVEITHKVSGAVTVLPAQTVVAALGFLANIGPIADLGGGAAQAPRAGRHRHAHQSSRTSSRPATSSSIPGKVPLISVGFGEAALAVNNAAPIVEPGMGIFPGHSSGGSAE